MSMALTITTTPAPTPAPAADAGRLAWIGLDEAAARSGLSLGQLRRRCLTEWQGRGLARMERRGAAKASWHVREDADPGFVRVKHADAIGRDLSGLTDRQRDTALYRECVLNAWSKSVAAAFQLGFDREAGTGQFLQLLHLGRVDGVPAVELSRATLYNWQRQYKAGGLAALADGRAGRAAERQEGNADDPFFALVREAYLHPNRPTLANCHFLATVTAEQKGWEVRSYKACQRMIGEIPKPVVIRAREGAKAAKDQVESNIKRDYSGLASNEVWCGDHHRLDVVCAVADEETGEVKYRRPWLTAWLDVRSRKLVGWHLFAHDPNADVILRAFASGAAAHGLPAHVQVDNGKDYDARSLQGTTKRQRRAGVDPDRVVGAFRSLDVGVMHVWPYHGQSKPIERFFGSLADRFAKLFETYTGGSTATKPEQLAQFVRDGRAPTLEEVRRALGEWLLADYHHRPHLGDGMNGRTPEQVHAAELASRRTLPEASLWFACLPRVGPVKVGQAGVTWKGMSWGGFDGALKNKLWGQRVYLAVDKDDVSRVFLVSLEGRLVGEARSNTVIPFRASDQDVRAAIAAKRSATKASREYRRQRPRIGMDVQQIVADAAAKRALAAAARPDPTLPPPSVRPAFTPFDQDSAAVQRAFEAPLKAAVGAESVPFPAAADAAAGRFNYRSASSLAEDGAAADPEPSVPSMREYLAHRAARADQEADHV
jgi:hypothetical protein